MYFFQFIFYLYKNLNLQDIMKRILLLITLCLSIQLSKAQELETILLAADDASLLAENYLNPAMTGLMYSMNGGWYSTAKTHKLFGFDITINANASFVPNSDELFDFIPSQYMFVRTANGETQIPTVMSESDTETTIDVVIDNGDGTFRVASFDMPGGIGDDVPFGAVPSPMIQGGLGLPFKTDLKVRFVPTLNFDDDIEANLIGFGLQHDIMQYFGPLDKLPLNLSVLAAFTSMNVTYDINDDDLGDNVAVTNGEAEFKMNTWTVQAIASLDFPVVTVYGSVGYNNGKTEANMNGDYVLTYDLEDNNGNTIGSVNESISNPIDLDFEANGMRATLGARLNLGFFKIFADYTFQEYNTATAGIAFSFR